MANHSLTSKLFYRTGSCCLKNEKRKKMKKKYLNHKNEKKKLVLVPNICFSMFKSSNIL
jgi:hypothetical protein